jgi:hypothetical protein
MKEILESVAARATNGWQRAGAKFDFEVFAMPGGSVMAPALWVYSMMVDVLKRSHPHSTNALAAPVAPADSETALSCAWPRCHST